MNKPVNPSIEETKAHMRTVLDIQKQANIHKRSEEVV